MPKGYTLYEMINFPYVEMNSVISAPQQQSYIQGLSPGRTDFKFIRRIASLNLEVFSVFHEKLEEKSGRAVGVDLTEVKFHQFLSEHHFPAFYHRLTKLLMLRTPKIIARSAIKELCNNPLVDGNQKLIKLQTIHDLIERYKGAWFKVDGSADVSTQALFGPSVDKDHRFERASSEGEMFNVRLDYTYDERLIHVGISSDCGVVVYDNDLDEESELKLVLDIKQQLLDKAEPKI